ncbi:MAG: cytochrome C oxidase Cbb3, partial [Rhodobacteraceae bacterium]|nr:cytochrome C oxidase Cbb3 [Paracoccaceae bacterium]
GISWMRDGRRVMATPHLREGMLSVIDVADWKVIATIPTAGPGFFLRSHENSPYVWADVFFGPNKDKMHVIDKETLQIVKTLDP